MNRLIGLLRIIRDSVKQMHDSDLRIVASALAFSTVLAIIPFLAITLSTFKTLGGLEFLYPKVEALILKNIAGAAGSEAIIFVKKAIHRVQEGSFGIIGGFFLVLATMRLLSDMDIGINRIWQIKKLRTFAERIFFYWIFVASIPFIIAGYVAVISIKTQGLALSPSFILFSNFIFLTFILCSIFKIVPNITVKLKGAIISAAISSVGLLITKPIFSLVIKEVFSLGKLYGSIANAMVFLFWILTIWYIILIGVAINATIQKRHFLDSQSRESE